MLFVYRISQDGAKQVSQTTTVALSSLISGLYYPILVVIMQVGKGIRMKAIEYIAQFEGIIGALLGVIVTFMMTYVLKKIGKIHVSSSNHTLSFLEVENDGSHYYVDSKETSKKIDEYSSGKYEFDLTFFNSTDESKGIKDITVVFVQKSNIKYVPRDRDTRRFAAGASWTDEIKLVNLPIREMKQYPIEIFIEKESLVDVYNCKKILLLAKDHRNKEMKWTLWKR